MWKLLKLFCNCFFSAVVFNYFILVLILLLNPNITIDTQDFFLLYVNLFIFYGTLWFVLIAALFFIIQFFSEKTYPIGIFSPPTITYFLSFTILVITFFLYLNYDYYFDFFAPPIKTNFIKILLINLGLIINGIIFIISKKIPKKWAQALFITLLAYNIVTSYSAAITGGNGCSWEADEQQFRQDVQPRKIRIVIVDGLSLNFILSISSEQRLPNFNLLLNDGVRGHISSFKPNLNLSLLNACLSGKRPSDFPLHSEDRFKISDLKYEFDTFPRYIFFRYSSNLQFITFYKKTGVKVLDHLNMYYRANHYRTMQLIDPYFVPIYSQRALYYNDRFKPKFSDILDKSEPKYQIIKKSFFFDDYIKSRIPILKDGDLYYSINQLHGLGTISKYFYQYYRSRMFENIPESEIKKYGWVVEKYYDYYDSIIGNLISTTGDDELLVILSFFEYEPLPYWRRILVNLFSDKDLYVYKSLDSQGTIFLYEKNALKRDYPLKTISIYDIFPTLLYYSGFQLSKDLQGEVRREIFTEDFLLNNPIDISTSNR